MAAGRTTQTLSDGSLPISDGAGALLALGVALMGVFILVLIAGVSDDSGTLAAVFMAGLWLVFLVRHPWTFALTSSLFGG